MIVTQAWGGATSHTGALYYSVDFALNFDTPVRSVGNGTVVDLRSDVPDGDPASRGSDDPSLGPSRIGNFVTIQYDEGFYASYLHLKQNSITINIGDPVSTGEIIGLVGNTGTRTGTHLHVQFGETTVKWSAGTIADGSLKTNGHTAPVLFATQESQDGRLIVGEAYRGDNVPPVSEVNTPPIVTTSNQNVDLFEWHNPANEGWFFAHDADPGDQIEWLAFYDGSSAFSSGYFWAESAYLWDGQRWNPTSGNLPSETVIAVAASELPDTWFRSASWPQSEALYVAASDGQEWSAWVGFTVTSEFWWV